jgi:8-oxo-dGTP diphosphatase
VNAERADEGVLPRPAPPASTVAPPAVAVDVAVFTVGDGVLQLLLVRVERGAFAGRWALPGGRVRFEETLEAAARRQLAAQAGLRGIYLEQLYTFGSPQRDPHGRVVSVAYFALIAHGGRFAGAAGSAAWWPVARLPALAYDHRAVVRTALARLRAKLRYTNPSTGCCRRLHARRAAGDV